MEARRKVLVGMLRDDAPDVRAAAAAALDRLDAVHGLHTRLGAVSSLARGEWVSLLRSLDGSRDETALKIALKALEHPGDDVRLAALALAGSFRDWRATQHLTRLLADPLPLVRSRAAEVLGELGDRRAVPALVRLLEDSDAQVLARTVQALGLLGYREGEKPFLVLAGHDALEVRAAAADALGRLGVSAPT